MLTFRFERLPDHIKQAVIWQQVPASGVIFQEGEVATSLFFLESGRVQIHRTLITGTSAKLYSLRAGEFFGEASLYSDVYHDRAKAIESSRIAMIPKAQFLATSFANADMVNPLLVHWLEQLQLQRILLELRAIRSARGQVWQYLQIIVSLIGNSGEASINFSSPLQEVARELGLTPEAFSRALKQLQQEKLISRDRRKITLHNGANSQ
jgi:CRP-like cAMP-binding protein